MIKLGESGIRPDQETMEYFRLPELSSLTTTDARAMKLLDPNRRRFSVLDIDSDTSIAMDADFISKPGQVRNFVDSGRLDTPYVEKAMYPRIDPFLHEIDMINEYINNFDNIRDADDDNDVGDRGEFNTDMIDENIRSGSNSMITNSMTAESRMNDDSVNTELDSSAVEISETTLMKRDGLRNKRKEK